MDKQEQLQYDKHEMDKHHEASIYESTYVVGRLDGKKEGLIEGEMEEKIAIAQNLLDVLDDATIASKTGLSVEEVVKLREGRK